MTAIRMPVKIGTLDLYPRIDGQTWAHASREWIGLSKVRLDGGFVFTCPTVPIGALFAETYQEPLPRIVKDGTALYVMMGEITVVRAILDGKPGFEALVIER